MLAILEDFIMMFSVHFVYVFSFTNQTLRKPKNGVINVHLIISAVIINNKRVPSF